MFLFALEFLRDFHLKGEPFRRFSLITSGMVVGLRSFLKPFVDCRLAIQKMNNMFIQKFITVRALEILGIKIFKSWETLRAG